MAKVLVRFKISNAPYNAGEMAAFDRTFANVLIKAGKAVEIGEVEGDAPRADLGYDNKQLSDYKSTMARAKRK